MHNSEPFIPKTWPSNKSWYRTIRPCHFDPLVVGWRIATRLKCRARQSWKNWNWAVSQHLTLFYDFLNAFARIFCKVFSPIKRIFIPKNPSSLSIFTRISMWIAPKADAWTQPKQYLIRLLVIAQFKLLFYVIQAAQRFCWRDARNVIKNNDDSHSECRQRKYFSSELPFCNVFFPPLSMPTF